LKKARKYYKKANLALGLWTKLARASAAFSRLSAENIRTFGLTEPQFAVLECLGHLGPLSPGALSKKMLVTNSNITCVVDNLVREGLVERARNSKDRRSTLVGLTPKGRSLFEDNFAKHADFIFKAVSILTETEQQTLAGLLKKLGIYLQDQQNKFHNGKGV
jgi:MarR family transcriptional regulator, 2-MHQ and catechol-resistance regulon repressor